MRHSLTITAAAAAVLLAATAAGPAPLAVFNGNLDGGAHPAVGFIFAQQSDPTTCNAEVVGCQGVLIAPDVLLTTGYCASVFEDASEYGYNLTAVWVTFNPDNALDCATAIRVKEFHTHPNFDETATEPIDDVGVMILESPSAATPAALPGLNALEGLMRGDSVVEVGFGALKGQNILQWVRRYGDTLVRRLDDQSVASRFTEHMALSGFGDGCGSFLGQTNTLAGIAAPFGGPPRQVTTQRIDIQSVRDFLGSFVTLP